jgi:hypothetical protein
MKWSQLDWIWVGTDLVWSSPFFFVLYLQADVNFVEVFYVAWLGFSTHWGHHLASFVSH